MDKQRTIANEVSISGVGLHTGDLSSVTFKPAAPDGGVTFYRVDMPGAPAIQADIDHVVDVSLGTTIGINGARIGTVEHVLASVAALGIDNVAIEVDGNEIPNGDGSALPFLQALKKAGVVEQDAQRKYVAVDEPVFYKQGDVTLSILPAKGFRVTATVEYDHKAVGTQYASFEITPEVFEREIAPARTFGFLRDAKMMQQQGLAKGGSLESALVFGDESFLNEDMRFPDEPVRHKILDVIGDLRLLGYPVQGHVIAFKPGHAKNVMFSKKLKKIALNGQSNADALAQPEMPALDVRQIMKVLPHRYPFLLVDRIVSFKPREYAVGIKNVTMNEPHFQGHWPGEPVMPGVLIIEVMAQVSSVLIFSAEGDPDNVAFFLGIDKAKFRRTVVPGDQLVVTAEMLQLRRNACKVKAQAKVDGQIVAQAEMLFGVRESEDMTGPAE